MPANLTQQYLKAEEAYRRASSPEEELECFQLMLRELPKHKGTDKLNAELKQKISKVKKNLEAGKGKAKKAHVLPQFRRVCRFTSINAPDTVGLLPAPDCAVLVHHQVAAKRSHRPRRRRLDIRPNRCLPLFRRVSAKPERTIGRHCFAGRQRYSIRLARVLSGLASRGAVVFLKIIGGQTPEMGLYVLCRQLFFRRWWSDEVRNP